MSFIIKFLVNNIVEDRPWTVQQSSPILRNWKINMNQYSIMNCLISGELSHETGIIITILRLPLNILPSNFIVINRSTWLRQTNTKYYLFYDVIVHKKSTFLLGKITGLLHPFYFSFRKQHDLNCSFNYEIFHQAQIAMATLPILVLFIVTVVQGDTKMLNTPHGKPGTHSDACSRVCSGVDDNAYNWENSDYMDTKVRKYIDMADCQFVSEPVVTAISYDWEGFGDKVCPSKTVTEVSKNSFMLYSVEEFTAEEMGVSHCWVFWIATGFVC